MAITRVPFCSNALGVGAVLAAATVAVSPGHAQTASQITPRTYALPPSLPASPVSPDETQRLAPPGADTIFVTLAHVDLRGAVLDGVIAESLRAQLIGHRRSIADIFRIAAAAEAEAARRGRVLLRVGVPRQQFADGGTLQLEVTDGYIERVDAASVPATIRARVAAVLASLVGRPGMTLARIERQLVLAGDLPGVALRSTLAPGTRRGAVVLRIDASWKPISGFVALDNGLSETLGREALAIGLDANSVFGTGELIYLRASGFPGGGRRTSFFDGTPRNRALAGGIVVPIGTDGVALTIEATDARTAPRRPFTLPGVASRFDRLSLRVRYPLIRSRALTIGVETSFDAQNERIRVIAPVTLPLSLDRLRIVRAAADLSAYVGGGNATVRVEGSFGLDALGARSAADATPIRPLSRAGADDDFRKLTVAIGIGHPIAAHLEANVEGRAQTSFGMPLVNSEQVGVASASGISPFASGSLQGDAGYVVRAEARSPWTVVKPAGAASVAPYLFVAQAGLRIEQATAVERRLTSIMAYGAGFRVAGQVADGPPGLSAGIEYGRGHVAGRRPDRFLFNVLGRF